ncbi:hypothetical protein AGMMS49928_10060 [Spirochaetia bacterium]|nr:hypothetical protein AGMMS49928_10060 [Spirochaetia bacterium]
MTKKYHVFISSTLDDLKNERRELIKIITELGQIPISMEDFDASDRASRRLIRKNIEECDYFLVLTAHKYGPPPPEGRSAGIEGEYAFAVKHDIPVIALIIDEKARWKDSKKEKDEAVIKALENFKEKLRSNAYVTWTSTADLRQKAMEILMQEMNLNPRQGWVPSGWAVEPLVANEIARLCRENEGLKAQNKIHSGSLMGVLKEQMKKTLKVLTLNKASLSFYYDGGENWENTQSFSYLRLYRLLAPELTPGKTTTEISRFLGKVLNPDLDKTIRAGYPVPSNTIKKLLTDFSILKIVKRRGNAKGDVWESTEYGKELYAAYRIRQMERALTKTVEAT